MLETFSYDWHEVVFAKLGLFHFYLDCFAPQGKTLSLLFPSGAQVNAVLGYWLPFYFDADLLIIVI